MKIEVTILIWKKYVFFLSIFYYDGLWQYSFANHRALNNTTDYDYKMIDVTATSCELIGG